MKFNSCATKMYRKLLQIVCIVHVIFLLFITCTFLNERNDDIVDVNALDEEEDYYERNENVDYKPVSSSSYVKYVTKSLVLLGEMDEISGHILFFNRIPNCGSEMLILLIQWLEGWNNFRHVRLKSGKKKLSRLEQEELVYNVYDIIKKEAVPLCFDQQVHFVNFTTFDRQSPTYINLIRDPTDLFYSRYVKKYGETKKAISFMQECLRGNINKCVDVEDLTIPYFCGQDNRCTSINEEWAYDRAKANVEKYYSVVGVLEEVNATIEVFENKMKYFFKGVQSLYYRDLLQQYRNKQRRSKPKMNDEIKKQIKRKLTKEYDFYEWIKSRLFQQLSIIYGDHNSH